MRTLSALLASTVFLVGLAFVGCTNGATTGDSSATSNSSGFGGNTNATPDCNGNQPDGFCNYMGDNPETCACEDCANTAACTSRCMDDGTCTLGADAEDCTCNDCYFKVQQCPPSAVGCDNNPDGVCDLDEDCVCSDCTNTDRCTQHCVDNGSCVPYLEGCSCIDCKPEKACGGNGGSSSSSSSSSAASSSSSSSASSSSSSSSSSSGGGGAGGAGGMSGTGGTGG